MSYLYSQVVSRRNLAEILLEFRNAPSVSAGESREDIGVRLIELAKRCPDAREKPYGHEDSVAGILCKGGIDLLESTSPSELNVTTHDCHLLASGYRMDVRLFDPLFSDATGGDSLRLALDKYVRLGPEEEEELAENYVPQQRLAGAATKVAVSRLVLPSGASSPLHWHPGEELLIPRWGSVEVFLCANGMRVRLQKGEYLHFYSDQGYLLHNAAAEPADLMIIRLGISSLRRELLESLRHRTPGSDVTTHCIREYRANVVSPGPSFPRCPVPIDRAALGRFLRSVVSLRFRRDEHSLTLATLADRGTKFRYNRSWIHRLHCGMAKVEQKDLLQLAEIYGLAAVLLVDFTLPTTRGAVMVRYDRTLPGALAATHGTMQEISEEYVRNDTCLYRVPFCRLADSDLSLAHLTLSSQGSGTPFNQHPGWEILVPLVGVFEMRLGDNSVEVDADKHAYLHFASSLQHRVRNPSNKPTEFLVIRIHV
jgi:hypothetical protein